ncbi:MAG: glycosyltransferase [Alphaproteobacteria bacterium]|nr:glycosyltransferase [Alphaproteobacteria bacterium]
MAASNAALVSIIIPAYNCEATIERAVESALGQSVAVEVVVVDDCSGDDTLEMLRAMAARDERLKVIAQSSNGGPARARNKAIQGSSAPWITPLDSDDFMAPDRIEKLLSQAREGGWDFIADDLIKVDESAIDTPKYRLWSQTDFGTRELTLEYFIRGNISANHDHRRELGFVKPLMKRSFLEAHDISYDENMRLAEDYDLYARALAAGARFGLVDPCGYYAVERAGSLSGAHSAKARAAIVACDRRLLSLPDIGDGARNALKAHMMESYRESAWMNLIDAVKARDVSKFISCFFAPPTVIASLAGKLGWQACLRSCRLIGFSQAR